MKKTLTMALAIVLVLVAALILGSCKHNKSARTDCAPTDTLTMADDLLLYLPEGADELFDDFLYSFMSARELQLSRTEWPLAVRKTVNSQAAAQKRETMQDATPITAKQWKTEFFFLPQGYYSLIFSDESQRALPADTSLTKATVEKIYLHDSTIQQYCFEKKDHKWWLCQLNEISFNHSPNADFLDFYRQFSSDEDFQLKSIANTLHFSGPNPDDDVEMDGIITAEQWPMFAPQLPRDVLYNIMYGDRYRDSDTRQFLICNVASEIGSELVFNRKGKRWQLTSFKY